MLSKLVSTPDQVTANLIRGFLESNGIETLGPQESPHVFLAGGDSCYYVEVREEDVERSVELLKDGIYAKWLLTA